MVISKQNSFRVLFDKIASEYFIWKISDILASEMVSPGNQHCANCIGTLSFPFGAERRAPVMPRRCCWAPAAVYRYLLPGRRSAANPPHAAAAVVTMMGRTDRQTDGRTPERYTDPAPHTMRTASIILSQLSLWITFITCRPNFRYACAARRPRQRNVPVGWN